MGLATIISGGPDGRYLIEIDLGEAQRVAIVDALTTMEAAQTASLNSLLAAVAVADAKEAAQRAAVTAAFDTYALEANDLPPGSPAPDDTIVRQELEALRRLQALHSPLRRKTAATKLDLRNTQRMLSQWTTFNAMQQRQAWCVDLTESAAGLVATAEIPGEPALMLVAPGGRAPTADDGYLRARELMSPWQAYFNAAILPGWQKEKPTYRWGTITGINWDAGTCDIELNAAVSSARRLPVDQVDALTGVQINYMTCGARCFSIGERVVVRFIGQNWGAPEMIGYVDTPRICPPTFSGLIPTQAAVEDAATSIDISGYWAYGKAPRSYTVHEGALPAGLSINAAGIINGSPTEYGSFANIVVRCSDAFYVAGQNRRYHDSNAFDLVVTPAFDWTSGALDAYSWTIVDSGLRHVQIVLGSSDTLGSPPSGYRSGYFGFSSSGTGTHPPADTQIFIEYPDGYGPTLYARLTIDSGDTPSGVTPGVWTAITMPNTNSSSGFCTWTISGIAEKNATFTIEIATDAAGTDVRATVTGSIHIQNL